MKRYAEYKDSGVPWIGEIPKNWEVKPIKYFTSSNIDILTETTPNDYEFRYVEIGSVTLQDGIREYQHMSFQEAPSRARRIVKRGDVIVSTVRTYLKAVAYIEDDDNVIVSTGFAVIRPKYVTPKYLKYSLVNHYFVEMVSSKSFGVSYPAINTSTMISIKGLLPPIEVQKRITNYLDNKTAAIDTFISDKQKMIDLLKEKRQAIISETVTKGLDKNVQMKDSGVEWIGEIPVGWEVKKIKQLGHVQGRIGFKGYTSQDLVDEDEAGRAIVLGGTNIMKNGTISYDKITYLSAYKFFESPEIMLKGGEILITKVGAGTGESALYKFKEDRVTINPNVMIIKPKINTSGKFINYYLLSNHIKNDMFLESNKSGAQPAINQDYVKNLRIVIPTIDVQENIVNYLDQKTAEIDNLISDITVQIEKLKEYRQAIISEAVTGKVAI